jgi:hypothetical protein
MFNDIVYATVDVVHPLGAIEKAMGPWDTSSADWTRTWPWPDASRVWRGVAEAGAGAVVPVVGARAEAEAEAEAGAALDEFWYMKNPPAAAALELRQHTTRTTRMRTVESPSIRRCPH